MLSSVYETTSCYYLRYRSYKLSFSNKNLASHFIEEFSSPYQLLAIFPCFIRAYIISIRLFGVSAHREPGIIINLWLA